MTDNMMIKNIKKIICNHIDINPDNITNDSELLGLGLTSFDLINIISECETEFGVFVPERDIQLLLTIDDIVEYLKAKMKENSAQNIHKE